MLSDESRAPLWRAILDTGSVLLTSSDLPMVQAVAAASPIQPVRVELAEPCPECGMQHGPGMNTMCSVGSEVNLQATVDRLADWIEANVEGAKVFRHNGLVVT